MVLCVPDPANHPIAISWVLAGGVAGAVIGPEYAKHTHELTAAPFAVRANPNPNLTLTLSLPLPLPLTLTVTRASSCYAPPASASSSSCYCAAPRRSDP